MNIKKIVNFFFEVMYLKRLPRSGLLLMGFKEVDSVAEHCLIAAQIAYILGKLENVNAERAALIALFHDNSETRLGDFNLVQQCYFDSKRIEKKAFLEQVKGLPQNQDLIQLFEDFEKGNTPEGVVARDAERLELAIQVKCLLDMGGSKSLQNWIDRVRSLLKTESAKKILDTVNKTDMNEWWRAIKGIKEERKRVERELDGSR